MLKMKKVLQFEEITTIHSTLDTADYMRLRFLGKLPEVLVLEVVEETEAWEVVEGVEVGVWVVLAEQKNQHQNIMFKRK